MSISANALYRSVALSFSNYDASGSEFVQLFAKPSGGSWSQVAVVPVAGLEQAMVWDTALPLTVYELAMRYVNGDVPTVGYESTNPDLWTASTAALSKTTVTTTSADVSGLSGVFVAAASPMTLSWSSAQLNVPYLVEKDVGAGWVTVATVTALSYAYTIPAGELGTTVAFRVTAKQGAVTGPTASTSVTMAITVGTPAWVSASFSVSTRLASLVWSAASNATGYQLYKSTDGGGSYSLVASPAGVSYDYTVPDAEINTTVKFKVRGTQGAFTGSYSAAQDLAMTLVVGATVMGALSFNGRTGVISGTTSSTSNATAYRFELSVDGGAWASLGTQASASFSHQVTAGEINKSIAVRAVGLNGAIAGPTGTSSSITATVSYVAANGLAFAWRGDPWTHLTWSTLASGDACAIDLECVSPTYGLFGGPVIPDSGSVTSVYPQPGDTYRLKTSAAGYAVSSYSNSIVIP